VLGELIGRGLLLFDRDEARYDLHPIVRQYAYNRLADKAGTHTRLREYFDAIPTPKVKHVQRLEDLAPTIELYHHTVHARGYDEAYRFFRDRLHKPLYYRFGAYQTCIELLRALFPDGEGHLPRLKDEANQAWTLNSLANSYALSGHPRRAVPLFEASNDIDERRGNTVGVAIGLANLVREAQRPSGELAAAERNLRRSIELCRKIRKDYDEFIGHQELGQLLAYRGAFHEARSELDVAHAAFEEARAMQSQCVVAAYRGLRALLMGNPAGARDAARRARDLADEVGRTIYPVQRDFVRANWLLGWATVALAGQDDAQADALLTEAEGHLTEALTRCRRVNLVELEPDILLAWGRWHHAKGDAEQARGVAGEALGIADRCEYRLKQAEIHNFLATLAHEGGDCESAAEHARTAYERAWCDGPPHCYKPALDEAKRLLDELGVSPPDVSA